VPVSPGDLLAVPLRDPRRCSFPCRDRSPPARMRILLLSAYDAPSHRQWREGLVHRLNDFQWTVLTLPPRNFAWRSRGNALTWAMGELKDLDKEFDLVLATSMTDLASLRGMAPSLARVRTIVYFHENQFAYPERAARKEYPNYKLTNLYTALSAHKVVFNSRHNKDTFLLGTRDFLKQMPDGVPAGVVEALERRTVVLPVPLEEAFFYDKPKRLSGPVRILWNHRWEHDKAPDRFFAALAQLMERDVPFFVHVLGQRFREVPPVFARARKRLGNRVRKWGFIEDEKRYRKILRTSDVVVSTALHDFQGLAVMEAVAAGCVPVVPDRLAYREFFPDECRFPSRPGEPEAESAELARRLLGFCDDPRGTRSIATPDLSRLSWAVLGSGYREIIEETAAGETIGD